MGDHYGDESQSASDQDELIGGSDLDADLTDTEEMQFTFCKGGLMDTLGNNNDQESCSNYSFQPQHEPKSKLIFFGMVIMLFLSAFVLLICFPLYFQQLNVGSYNNDEVDGGAVGGGKTKGGSGNVMPIENNKQQPHNNSNLSVSNAYGAILYVSTLITSFLLLATVIASWSLKWNLMVHKFPMPWKR